MSLFFDSYAPQPTYYLPRRMYGSSATDFESEQPYYRYSQRDPYAAQRRAKAQAWARAQAEAEAVQAERLRRHRAYRREQAAQAEQLRQQWAYRRELAEAEAIRAALAQRAYDGNAATEEDAAKKEDHERVGDHRECSSPECEAPRRQARNVRIAPHRDPEARKPQRPAAARAPDSTSTRPRPASAGAAETETAARAQWRPIIREDERVVVSGEPFRVPEHRRLPADSPFVLEEITTRPASV